MISHIQLPKSILKNFSYKSSGDGRMTKCLSLSDLEITSEKIKDLGTCIDFYSQEIEDKLSKFIEGPLGPVMRKFKEFQKGSVSSVQLTQDDHNAIKWFLNYMVYRSESFVSMVNEQAITTSIFGKMKRQDLFGMEQHVPAMDIFKDFRTNILINRTNVDFVVPRNGFYYYTDKKDQCFNVIFPFTPRIAFILKPKKAIETYVKDGYLYHFNIDDVESVLRLNRYAYIVEKNTNSSFIASKNVSELEDIRRWVADNYA